MSYEQNICREKMPSTMIFLSCADRNARFVFVGSRRNTSSSGRIHDHILVVKRLVLHVYQSDQQLIPQKNENTQLRRAELL